MGVIYDKEGEFDLSDDGKQAKQVMDSLDIEIAMKKLSEKEQQTIQLIKEGYTHREVAKQLKISSKTIRKTLDKLLDIIR